MIKTLLAVIVLVITGAIGYISTTTVIKNAADTNQSAVVYDTRKDRTPSHTEKNTEDPTLCLADTNKDGIINVFSTAEFYITSPTNCLQVNGAPGYTSIRSVERHQINSASSYPTPSTPSTPSNTNTNKPLSIQAILSPGEMKEIQADRNRSGVDKKKYKKGEYTCIDYARDFEKSNPDKYTVTSIRCAQAYSCINSNGKREYFYSEFGHQINDVHLLRGEKNRILAYIDPQTGQEVVLDGNGDKKVNHKDDIQVANSQGLLYELTEKSPEAIGCKKGTFRKETESDFYLWINGGTWLGRIKDGLQCEVTSSKDAKEAFEKLPEVHRKGFNPN